MSVILSAMLQKANPTSEARQPLQQFNRGMSQSGVAVVTMDVGPCFGARESSDICCEAST